MASKLLLSILLLHISYNSPPSTVVAQCPYPCYPPPTAGAVSNAAPATTMPPPFQTGNYPPPVAVYSTPSNVIPYNPPNPVYYGGAPPPPDPIVPWFPYYYKDSPRNPHKSSSTDLHSRSTVVIFLILVMVFSSCCLND